MFLFSSCFSINKYLSKSRDYYCKVVFSLTGKKRSYIYFSNVRSFSYKLSRSMIKNQYISKMKGQEND